MAALGERCAQEEIIARVEALLESNDLAEGMRQLGRLQDEWAGRQRDAGQVAGALGALPDGAQRAPPALRRLPRENLEKKRALCAEVAGLGDSTAWNETADLIRRLQAEVEGDRPGSGQAHETLWQEFREPCDRFFARRKEHFERLDEERRERAAKTSLCEQAEALADSTDWDATATAMKRLQAEWKTSGGPPRARPRRSGSASGRPATASSTAAAGARSWRTRRRCAAPEICDELEALAASLGGEDAPAADASASRSTRPGASGSASTSRRASTRAASANG